MPIWPKAKKKESRSLRPLLQPSPVAACRWQAGDMMQHGGRARGPTPSGSLRTLPRALAVVQRRPGVVGGISRCRQAARPLPLGRGPKQPQQ